MKSPEFPSISEDPKLSEIIELYGDLPLRNHQGQLQPLRQAVAECPPFADALLRAESSTQLEQIIEVLRAPE